MKTFNCYIAQPGLYAGRIKLFNAAVKTDPENRQFEAEKELLSFDNSIKQLKSELENSNLGRSNSEILDALSMILEDDSFINGVREKIISESFFAETAVEKQTVSIIAVLENSDSDYLRNRCADVRGISERLIAIINGSAESEKLTETSVIASDEISPILLSSIEAEYIGALISDKGSPNSHAAIIAGNLGVPYLYGAGEALSEIKDGQLVIVDGYNGVLTVEPYEDIFMDTLAKMEVLAKEREETELEAENISCRTKIMANIAGPEDIPELLKANADGVGLFRSEFLFLNGQAAPSEEEQYQAYTKVLEAMGNKEVIIRTMDLGSDKTASWLDLPKEINPALGLRGVRVSFERDDLFNTQLRALLRAAAKGNLKVMFPMIASEWEVDEILKTVKAVASELDKEGIEYSMPEIGIMIETPAACMTADELAKKVSFFSIGTNDLTQYTLALDREAEGMDKYFNPRHEAVLRLIEMAAEKAHENGITIGICGQLAADPQVTKRLVGCGIDELSVAISKVKATRKLVFEAEAEVLETGASAEGMSPAPLETVSRNATPVSSKIAAVADGELIPMAEIPDEAFASGVLGPCIGILPSDGNVYSPCDGKIISVAETKHAITVESGDGVQYLIHMGIETVKLGGRPFKVKVAPAQSVKSGDLLAVMDLKAIEKQGCSTVIITVRL